ncbi:MAG: AMP-binding protein [Acidimicrobiales bacterium]|jgi:fatty-acyl-CoA synthase
MIGSDGLRRATSGVVSGVASGVAHAVSGTAGAVTATSAVVGSGLARTLSPAVVVRSALALARDGITPAAACAVNAARFPSAAAVIDDDGETSFGALHRQVRALADALAAAGVTRRDRVGVLCRNHVAFVEATFAVTSLGADVVFLNTSFAAEQTGVVVARQGLTALVHDEEFAPHALAAAAVAGDLHVWRTTRVRPESGLALDGLLPAAHHTHLPPPMSGRFVLLTSGSTGAPKGAPRSVPPTLDPLVALLTRIPLHVRDVTLVASPLFHAWGFGQLGLGLVLSSTLVLHRRFDPVQVLESVERHRVRVLAVVPVMLKRLAELPPETRRRFDTSSLAVVASSGAHLPGPLATRFMDAFGDVLYNVYGSTETGYAAIATPEDLRAAPGTAGRPPWRTEVRIVDDAGHDVAQGHAGRILVRNRLLLEHDSDGRRLPRLGGYMDSGDVGRTDAAGRLFVEGRQDDMIVSGGENVYPQEVEELIAGHPAVADVAVVAVQDAEFGQRLRALVVCRPGHELSGDDVKAFVRDHLARYKAPREVVFLDRLPHNEVGKLVRSDPYRN